MTSILFDDNNLFSFFPSLPLPSFPFFQIIVSPLAFLFGYYSLATPGGSFVDYWLFTLLLYLSVMGMANFITVLVPGKSKGLVANGIIVILWAFGGKYLFTTLYWILYCAVLYCIVLYCTVLYSAVLYCAVSYCPVLCCIILYCIILCCIFFSTHMRLFY